MSVFKGEAGTSLVEVIVATTILGITLFVIMTDLSGNLGEVEQLSSRKFADEVKESLEQKISDQIVAFAPNCAATNFSTLFDFAKVGEQYVVDYISAATELPTLDATPWSVAAAIWPGSNAQAPASFNYTGRRTACGSPTSDALIKTTAGPHQFCLRLMPVPQPAGTALTTAVHRQRTQLKSKSILDAPPVFAMVSFQYENVARATVNCSATRPAGYSYRYTLHWFPNKGPKYQFIARPPEMTIVGAL